MKHLPWQDWSEESFCWSTSARTSLSCGIVILCWRSSSVRFFQLKISPLNFTTKSASFDPTGIGNWLKSLLCRFRFDLAGVVKLKITAPARHIAIRFELCSFIFVSWSFDDELNELPNVPHMGKQGLHHCPFGFFPSPFVLFAAQPTNYDRLWGNKRDEIIIYC